MQPLSPIQVTGAIVNSKFRPSRRPDPYLKITDGQRSEISTQHPSLLQTPQAGQLQSFMAARQRNVSEVKYRTQVNNNQMHTRNTLFSKTTRNKSHLSTDFGQFLKQQEATRAQKTPFNFQDSSRFQDPDQFLENESVIKHAANKINAPVSSADDKNRRSLLYEKLNQRKKQLVTSNDVGQLSTNESRLGDPYLPVLRSFMPSHNVTHLNKDFFQDQVRKFNREKLLSQQRTEKKKQVDRVAGVQPLSLKEKQQIILAKAKYHQMPKQEMLAGAFKAPVKGWYRAKNIISQLYGEQTQETRRSRSHESSRSSVYSLASDTSNESNYELKSRRPVQPLPTAQWEKMQKQEYEKLQRQWDRLFQTKMEVKSNEPVVVQDQYKKYFFDEQGKRGYITDELSPEEQKQVMLRFDQLMAIKNKDKLRVQELADIVRNTAIRNLRILEKYEGKYTKQVAECVIKDFEEKFQQAMENKYSSEPSCLFDEEKAEKNEVTLIEDIVQRKNMFQPHKQLELDEFGKDLLLKIMDQFVNEQTFAPKMMQTSKASKPYSFIKSAPTAEQGILSQFTKTILKQPVDQRNNSISFVNTEIQPRKTIFTQSKVKEEFYQLAKNSAEMEGLEANAMKKFYEDCTHYKIAANPIFSRIQDKKCNIVGQYINHEQAIAFGNLLKNLTDSKEMQFEEITLDGNGLRDEQFSVFLQALYYNKSLSKISYLNNEFGRNSITELQKLLKGDGGQIINELRIVNAKTNAYDLTYLLQVIQSSKDIEHLCLSNLQINNQVQVAELNKCIRGFVNLKELNISYQGLTPKQLNDIMLCIVETQPKIQILNLSGNPLSDCKNEDKHANAFIANLLRLIENSDDPRLIDLDLSNMNLKDRVDKLSWAIKSSKTLMAVHLSHNHISKEAMNDLLMVFGIRRDKFNMAGKELGFAPYTKAQTYHSRWHVKPSQRHINVSKKQISIINEKATKEQRLHLHRKSSKMPQTIPEASAYIVNIEQMKEAQEQMHILQSQTKNGIGGFSESTEHQLVISRVLGHNELVFNMKFDKNSHFSKGASERWSLNEKCWLCEKSRYTVIVFNREIASNYFTEVTDPEILMEIKRKFHDDQQERIVAEKPDAVQIMGSLTNNVICNMLEINYFNFLLDSYELKSTFKDKSEAVVNEIIAAALGQENGVYMEMQQPENCQSNSYKKLLENLPTSKTEMTMLGISSAREFNGGLDSGTNSPSGGSPRSEPEGLFCNNDIYVFAGFLPPGKHQMVIYDTKTRIYYARDFIIDARTEEIDISATKDQEPLFANEPEIKQHLSGMGNTWLDLHNSVFMNFTRITKQTMDECFKLDMQYCVMRTIIGSELDLASAKQLLGNKYSNMVKFFQRMGSRFDTFPHISFDKVPLVLDQIGVLPLETGSKMQEKVLELYKEFRPEARKDYRLNRMTFIEVLLLYIELVSQSEMETAHPVIQTIMEAPYESKFTRSLSAVLDKMQKYADDSTQIEFTLTKFRLEFVWTNTVNTLFALNLRGLMQLFNKYRQKNGLTSELVIKMVEDAKMKLLNKQDIRTMCNLSQMIVLDETNSSSEYTQIELAEFLELIVRLSYLTYLAQNPDSPKPSLEMLSRTIAQFVTDILALDKIPFVDSAKTSVAPQLDESDYKKLNN